MDAATAPASTTPAAHLRLALLRSVIALMQRATLLLAPLGELLQRFPALQHHMDAAAALGLEGRTLEEALPLLHQRLWAAGDAALPLHRLREALGNNGEAVDLFLLCALADEDPALQPFIDALGGREGRPTRGTLPGEQDLAIEALLAGGYLVEVEGRWRALAVPPPVWQAAQGRGPGYTPPAALPLWSELVLPEALHATPGGGNVCWVIRGADGSGRHALAGAIARDAGLGLLERPDLEPAQLAACATLLHAMPLLTLAPQAGECALVPALPGWDGPLAVRVPPQGGVAAEYGALRWLELAMPGPEERLRHWQAALGRPVVDPALVALRLPRGRIHRLAREVGADAALVAGAVDAQGAFLLDGLAQRVPALGAQEALAVPDELEQEFDLLVARCRHRETLPALLPAAFGTASAAGVRALFKGPSGTGKTLAARQLASALGRPLFRVNLAGTVSKYIGDTERNLERVFAAAEALDIVLLLDEGDALMAGRTGVTNANDRYANLETNYLLQRLESFDGLLIVTTNAADRIDPAFARRMDATLEFALPDPQTRYRLWRAQLPPVHRIGTEALEEVALRCSLSGGQIRNAALHATLLALERGNEPGEDELAAALRREYRRAGQACPSLAIGDLV